MICDITFYNPNNGTSTPPAIHFHQQQGNPDLYEFDNLALTTDCNSLTLTSDSFFIFFSFFGIILFISCAVLIANLIRRKV